MGKENIPDEQITTDYRVNCGKGVLLPFDKRGAINYMKGLAGYAAYASIERKNEDGEWKGVKIVPKKKE